MNNDIALIVFSGISILGLSILMIFGPILEEWLKKILKGEDIKAVKKK